mgnify:CR=1 FL=1
MLRFSVSDFKLEFSILRVKAIPIVKYLFQNVPSNIDPAFLSEVEGNLQKSLKAHDTYLETRGPVSKSHRCNPLPFSKELRKKKKYKSIAKVNKSNNAVVLVHQETKVFVKCHDTRSLDKNRSIAQNRLVDKLDFHLNGDKSVEAQVKKIEKEREIIRKEKAKLKREEKALNKLR